MWLFGRKKKKAKEEAERKAREEAEAKRLEEERLEKERKAKEEAERKAKEEAEAKAKEEAEAKAQEEVEAPKESTQEIKVTKPAGKKVYHVVKRPKDNKWCVKIEGSDRAIKLFDTKPEALAYSEKLAANQDGTLRVHASKGKNKGKIQANK